MHFGKRGKKKSVITFETERGEQQDPTVSGRPPCLCSPFVELCMRCNGCRASGVRHESESTKGRHQKAERRKRENESHGSAADSEQFVPQQKMVMHFIISKRALH